MGAALAAFALPLAAYPVAAETAVAGDARAPMSDPSMTAAIAPPAAAPPLFVDNTPPVDLDALLNRVAGASAANDGAARDDASAMPYVFVDQPRDRRRTSGVQRVSLTGTAGSQGALGCMTMAIAYEAGNQPVAGMESVGQVILNRMRTARFPKSACGVVFQGAERHTGCQFTFACDGSLRRSLLDATVERSRAAALAVLTGAAADHVAGATHYHADYVLPRWASDGTRVTKIGAHIFYRMPGDGSTSAVAEPYTGATDFAPAQGGDAVTASIAQPRGAFAPWGLPIARAGQ
jgi:hypothetical protein